jgi:hypothetical protein
MKCTECNRTIKPVVAVDIDGTMGMYHKHFLEFASDYLNQQVKDHYVGNQPFKEWFCSNYRVTTDVWHDIKLAYRQGGMKRTMPVYPDARELCQSIQKAGAELWVTTTRPYIRHDNIDPDTREWLRRHHIPYDYLIYDGHKYKKLAQLVGPERVCAVLDDLQEELIEAEDMFADWVPILRKQSFNRATKWRAEVTNLEMASRFINDRIKLWKEIHNDRPIPSDGGGHPTESNEQILGEVT